MRTPATSIRSLTAIGRPWRYPGGISFFGCSSIWRAFFLARSKHSVGSAFILSSVFLIRSSAASISSIGEISPFLRLDTASRAVSLNRFSISYDFI